MMFSLYTSSSSFTKTASTIVSTTARHHRLHRKRSSLNVAVNQFAFSSASKNSNISSGDNKFIYPIVPKDDFGEFKEYSVIHTNRSLNLMSYPFQQIMRDLNKLLKKAYNAEKIAIIPGSGTFGMEAVAREFATDEHVMVLRNGWFSYRWTEIFDMGKIPKSHTVLMARQSIKEKSNVNENNRGGGPHRTHTQYVPHPIEDVVAKIYDEKPAVVFAPHVETSTGMILPDDYIRDVSRAVHDVGGLFVLDCIASGTIWVDMKNLGVDVTISAPQKGWSGPCCVALVAMSERAVERMQQQESSSSFSLSLKRWTAIMDTYANGGFGYHTTMPTDALRDFHEVSVETLKFGLPELKVEQTKLGKEAHKAMAARGLVSVAAPGFQSPSVLVYYSPLETIENLVMMNKFKENGLQIAMGVPWKINEPHGVKTFRMGLFGLDKIGNISETVKVMEGALESVLEDFDEQKVMSPKIA